MKNKIDRFKPYFEKPLLYKYRGIQSFKHLTDIFLNSRMYAAPYFDLNDPMEGHYLVGESGEFDQDMEKFLKGEKEKIRILSLSRRPDISLMWTHYAEGHKGVAIGVEIDRNLYSVRPIDYDGPMHIGRRNFHQESAIDILTKKLSPWKYEEEERVFVTGTQYVNVSVKEVILGSRMSKQDKGFIKDLVNMLSPKTEVVSQRVFGA